MAELSRAMKIMHANESGGFWASSPLYFRLRTLRITFTILSESCLALILVSFPPPLPAPNPSFPAWRGLRMALLPGLLTWCGEPVRAVHIDVNTPGFWSHERLVNSLSKAMTVSSLPGGLSAPSIAAVLASMVANIVASRVLPLTPLLFSEHCIPDFVQA